MVDITATISEINITVTIGASFTVSHLASGQKLFFEGANSDTYIWYNPTTERLEVYRDGVKRGDF